MNKGFAVIESMIFALFGALIIVAFIASNNQSSFQEACEIVGGQYHAGECWDEFSVLQEEKIYAYYLSKAKDICAKNGGEFGKFMRNLDTNTGEIIIMDSPDGYTGAIGCKIGKKFYDYQDNQLIRSETEILQ